MLVTIKITYDYVQTTNPAWNFNIANSEDRVCVDYETNANEPSMDDANRWLEIIWAPKERYQSRGIYLFRCFIILVISSKTPKEVKISPKRTAYVESSPKRPKYSEFSPKRPKYCEFGPKRPKYDEPSRNTPTRKHKHNTNICIANVTWCMPTSGFQSFSKRTLVSHRRQKKKSNKFQQLTSNLLSLTYHCQFVGLVYWWRMYDIR